LLPESHSPEAGEAKGAEDPVIYPHILR